jgi:hypothetical protein
VILVKATPPQAFIDLQGTGVYALGDPLVVLTSSVYVRTYADGPPALANLETQALASAADPSLDTVDNPTFGPRGLPCKPKTAGGFTTCPAFSAGVLGTSYITFFQSMPDQNWLAVVTNPASRIRIFAFSGGSWRAQ